LIKKIDKRFIKFLLVGALNTVFGYSVFALFIFFNVHYSVSLLIATILGVIFNFKTIGIIVFKNQDNKLIFKFVCIYVIYYFLNLLGLKILNIYSVSNYIGQAVLVLPLSVLSYLLFKKFVFTRPEKI